jgi:hypothetical protein
MSESRESSPSERRRHARVIANLAVRSRPLEPGEVGSLLNGLGDTDPEIPVLGMKKSNAGAWTMASTNLSVGGLSATGDLQVLGDKPIAKGADLMVEMDMNDGIEPVRAIAQVMWVTNPGDGKYLAGMMLVVISENNLERIRKYVEKAVEAGQTLP